MPWRAPRVEELTDSDAEGEGAPHQGGVQVTWRGETGTTGAGKRSKPKQADEASEKAKLAAEKKAAQNQIAAEKPDKPAAKNKAAIHKRPSSSQKRTAAEISAGEANKDANAETAGGEAAADGTASDGMAGGGAGAGVNGADDTNDGEFNGHTT